MQPRSLVNSLAQPLAPSFIHGPPRCRQDCYADVCCLREAANTVMLRSSRIKSVSMPFLIIWARINLKAQCVKSSGIHGSPPLWNTEKNKIFRESHLQSFYFFSALRSVFWKIYCWCFVFEFGFCLKKHMNILVPQMPKKKTKILNETFKILPSLIMSCLCCYLSYGLRKKHEDPVKIPSVLDTSECLFLAIKNTTLWM